MHTLGFPDKEALSGKRSTVQYILTHFNIPNKKRRSVVRVLTDVQFCITNNITHHGKNGNINNTLSRPTTIDTWSIKKRIIANWMEQGVVFGGTTYMVNKYQKDKGMIHVGVSAVRNTIQRMHPVMTKMKKKV